MNGKFEHAIQSRNARNQMTRGGTRRNANCKVYDYQKVQFARTDGTH